MNILSKIVESKKREIERLYEQHDLAALRVQFPAPPSATPLFYQRLAEARTARQPFFITEFKRKSPSEGWINQHADLPTQVRAYAQAGASAISVLTDEPFFGGTYADLRLARQTVDGGRQTTDGGRQAIDGGYDLLTAYRLPSAVHRPPLLLQKDFILDPIQIHLARLYGADLILLIAAILEPERLDFLRKTAESLGMGALVEVHDAEELDKIRHLDFPVLGVNNRDLRTFRTALNRVNVVGNPSPDPSSVSTPPPTPPLKGRGGETQHTAQALSGRYADISSHISAPLPFSGGAGGVDTGEEPGEGSRFLIAESGIRDYRDFQMVRRADGFLIGTGLMKESSLGHLSWGHSSRGEAGTFAERFQAQGKRLFKACGVRTPEVLSALTQGEGWAGPDFIGINFSPLSKRRASVATCEVLKTARVSDAVAVFYKNSEAEIRAVLAEYPFQTVQLYADDVTPEFVRSLRQRVFLALSVRQTADLQRLEAFVADVDLFILDGAVPGSGQRIGAAIPADFPYPFLLAGGLHEGNLDAILPYKNCIGVDIASGIETDGAVDVERVRAVGLKLESLKFEV